ncbi:bifunctional DNA-binding transcriptional regulator/O6-methylguanine-DNA methyltransferase Ada [Imbroritus primus]|uniref:bifunctional DNA-binding transcriptional regulator/O6-methylguanine-DNA methyltransferase Ada n=1 Tax=Imbroritus primus TaxID=3058603 RepID=UPI003D162245
MNPTSTQRRHAAAAAATEADPRWPRVVNRDASADGTFWYAVSTTGVYCRPSCGARLARPEHVRFYASREAAEQDGFRPCKRCRPDAQARSQQQAEAIVRACRHIEQAEAVPSLQALAHEAGMSRFHFHRLFKAMVGLTPRAYAQAWRSGRIRAALQDEGSVLAAVYAAGYASTGRFYADSDAVLGMTPTRFRQGGTDTQIRFAIAASALGALLVAQSTRGICAIALGDDADQLARDLQDRFPQAMLVGDDPDFARTVAQVVGFVEMPALGLDLPLDIRGTAFQQRVWQALREVPAGETVSYTELAQRLGVPRAVRAVASACAANTLAVAVPCHRVVRQDGSLSGYRWGVERKRALIDREARGAVASGGDDVAGLDEIRQAVAVKAGT